MDGNYQIMIEKNFTTVKERLNHIWMDIIPLERKLF